MILVADSGSTKTNWIVVDNKKTIFDFTTIGLNPYYIKVDEIPGHIEKSLPADLDEDKIEKIFFYGSGCAAKEKSELIKTGLNLKFKNAKINVFTDLLGSARAMFGESEGIICILGTGANTGFYDGNDIIKNIPGFGYILGDQGSGANLGLKLIKLFLHNELPLKIRNDFNETFKLTESEILDRVYRLPMPNRFFASFTKFIFANIEYEIIHYLVIESFGQFFDKYICRYEDFRDYKIKMSGSVAFRFRELLQSVAGERDIVIGEIIKFPIERLAKFHYEY